MSLHNSDQIKPLILEEQITKRVKELGAQIQRDYQDKTGPLVLIGVLKGSILFLADLARAIDLPLELEMMGVSSYGEATRSSGVVKITQDLMRPIKDKHVIIVEDIFDTGLTVKYLAQNLKARSPKSIKICTFIRKNTTGQIDIPLDYIGFNIPDKFVVGYGLDVAERFRNLPMVAEYQPE